IEDQCGNMGESDRVAVVVFGREAGVEQSADLKLLNKTISTQVNTDATDIGAALRLALALFPEGSRRRIVLMSDGNENRGSAIEEARVAALAGAHIDALPFEYQHGGEVIVDGLYVPSDIKEGEPFDVKCVVNSMEECRSSVRLLLNGVPVVEGTRALEKGKNVLVIPSKALPLEVLRRKRFAMFELVVEPESDSRPENNRAFAFTYQHGLPQILYVDGNESGGDLLEDALLSEKIAVVRVPAGALPSQPGELQNYDAIILSNVPASALTKGQMELMRSNVRDLGIGLVMIGGPDSFGAGGYTGTPVEDALPVLMEIPQRKVMPNGALVLVLHTCEIPDGNTWATKVGIAAIDVLSARDYAGALVYGYSGAEQWLFPLREVGDKSAAKSALRKALPGDMPTFDATLKLAHEGLNKIKAALKHIIIISDGDPSPPNQTLADNIVKDKITISTVCIAPHSNADVTQMTKLAEWGKGRMYNVTDPASLPQIFVKEAAVIRKALIIEEPFVPKAGFAEYLRGIDLSRLPRLYGFVCTTPKPEALVEIPLRSKDDDPVLAHWRYGLGKAVAFTSDATTRWAKDWSDWEMFPKFWSQIVRWVLRSAQRSQFPTEVFVEGSRGRVVIDAVDEDGQYVDMLKVTGTVVDPAYTGAKLDFQQIGPGRYEASFEVSQAGAYVVNVGYEGEGQAPASFTAGAGVPFAPEYRDIRTNKPLLEQIAAVTGGRIIDDRLNSFRRDLGKASRAQDLWWPLMLIAVCLVPVDVFVRRVAIEREQVAWAWSRTLTGLRGVLERLRLKKSGKSDATLAALLGTKDKLRKEQEAQRVFKPAPQDLARDIPMPTVAAPASPEKPPAQAGPKQAEPEKKPTPAADDYTARLLEAKRRAKKRQENE
ncbi:MAG: glutamine amidotransferase, partial [Planctomycetota bacterium]|nr:glutamine amidotransferase [Planctomycetota bacterium]